MDAQLKRGFLEICVLAQLCKGESYGYRIIKDISPFVSLSESALYHILKRLEAGGLVKAQSVEHDGRLRRVYSITQEGRMRRKTFLLEWQGMEKILRFIKEAEDHDEA